MAAINEAWHVLGDPTRRAEYDRTLDGPASRPEPAPPQSPPPPTTSPVGDLWQEPDEPLTRSAEWTRRWAIGVGVLTALAMAFAALLVWIALGGGT